MPRLYHTKSKTGCIRCRARRVKCDEARPKCGGCARHQVECVFDRVRNDAEGSSPNSVSPSASGPEATSKKGDEVFFRETRDRRYRELRLLHTFSTDMIATLPGTHDPQLFHTWSIAVPRFALEYEPLLHAVLAYACQYEAVHWKQGDPDAPSPSEYMTWHARYLEKTLQEYRVDVAQINSDNADAVSFTTAVVNLDAFANLVNRPLVPYEPPVSWVQLSRGIGQVCKLALGLLQDDPEATIWPLINSFGPTVQISIREGLSTTDGGVFHHLLREMEGQDDPETPEEREAYRLTARLLGWIQVGHEARDPVKLYCRRLTAFSSLIPARYIELLDERRPRALVLMAYFFAFVSYAKELWWIGGMPRREVRGIQDSGLVDHPFWQEMMRWPLEVTQ